VYRLIGNPSIINKPGKKSIASFAVYLPERYCHEKKIYPIAFCAAFFSGILRNHEKI